MQQSIQISIILLLSAISFAGSSNKNSSLMPQYVPATVLDLHEEETQSNYVGDSPSDAPLHSEVHIYDVSIRLDSGNYAGRYKSAFDYSVHPDVKPAGRSVPAKACDVCQSAGAKRNRRWPLSNILLTSPKVVEDGKCCFEINRGKTRQRYWQGEK